MQGASAREGILMKLMRILNLLRVFVVFEADKKFVDICKTF